MGGATSAVVFSDRLGRMHAQGFIGSHTDSSNDYCSDQFASGCCWRSAPDPHQHCEHATLFLHARRVAVRAEAVEDNNLMKLPKTTPEGDSTEEPRRHARALWREPRPSEAFDWGDRSRPYRHPHYWGV